MTVTDASGRARRRLPRLHAVTDDGVLAAVGWADRAAEVLEAGGGDVALHLRGREVDAGRLLDLVDALREPARRTGSALLVNDRVDVALAGDADGVHVGVRSLTAERARAVLGPDKLVGVSCHGADEAASVATDGADFVFLGTIHPTASHPGVAALGVGGVERAVGVARLPVIGIGGIGPAETPAIVAAGAYGVAAIRGIWRSDDPAGAVKQYLQGLSDQE